MGRLTKDARDRAEKDIRAAMDRILGGDLPSGGRCDIATLAAAAEVSRTGFYRKDGKPGPWQHLADEFRRRLAELRETGRIPDARDARITRLKSENDALRRRLARQDATIAEHAEFRQIVLSRLAAQHEELQRLRRAPGRASAPVTILRTDKESSLT